MSGGGAAAPKHRAVAVDAARFVGDPAAFVVARDRHAARHAVVVATAPAAGGRPRAEADRLRPLAASDVTASALDSDTAAVEPGDAGRGDP